MMQSDEMRNNPLENRRYGRVTEGMGNNPVEDEEICHRQIGWGML